MCFSAAHKTACFEFAGDPVHLNKNIKEINSNGVMTPLEWFFRTSDLQQGLIFGFGFSFFAGQMA